jgi:hypothetical protein
MRIDRNEGARSTAVMFAGITAVTVSSLRTADTLTRLQWAGVAFTRLIAATVTSWLTWRRLTRYLPFVPREAKRLLMSAAGTFILLGVYAFLLVMSAAKR